MEFNVITLLLVVLALTAGIAAGVFLRQRLVEGNQKNLAQQGKQIIENSIHEAEQIKKSAILQAKEDALKLKQDADREIKSNWQELKEEQRRINRKSDEIQREGELLEERLSSLEQRQQKLAEQEAQVESRNRELGELVATQFDKLESIADITREEAKKELMDSMESEARMDCVKRLMRIENDMKLATQIGRASCRERV